MAQLNRAMLKHKTILVTRNRLPTKLPVHVYNVVTWVLLHYAKQIFVKPILCLGNFMNLALG